MTNRKNKPIAIGFVIEKLGEWLDSGIGEITLDDMPNIFNEIENREYQDFKKCAD